MNYPAAKEFIITKLRTELSNELSYHGIHHTLDVLQMVSSIGRREGVSAKDLVLLKTAALFHDAGFVKNKHAGHEAEGCIIARDVLPSFGYSSIDIEQICGMIMATRIPQDPKSILEQIICDADLDYLGRKDFYTIGRSLFREMLSYGLIYNERDWNILQVNFLSKHSFHTDTNKRLREPVKQKYLKNLEVEVSKY